MKYPKIEVEKKKESKVKMGRNYDKLDSVKKERS